MRNFQKVFAISMVVIALSFSAMIYYELSFSRDGSTPSSNIEYWNISVEEAKELIESNPLLVIVDVRTDTEFKSDHIEGAINLCVCDEEGLLNTLNHNDEILVYCLTGTRSAEAMMILHENGYTKVYNMLGGITEWIELGYPVVGE